MIVSVVTRHADYDPLPSLGHMHYVTKGPVQGNLKWNLIYSVSSA